MFDWYYTVLSSSLLLLLLPANIVVNGCYAGIQSIGTVSPLGDIILAVGDDIIINCTIHQNYSDSADSSDIRWRRNQSRVDTNYISIVTNQTAQLRIPSASVEDSGFYTCFADVGGKDLTVCNNDIRVGYPPATNVNISCLSRNWQNLTCKWALPFNPVPTTWRFHYRLTKYKPECPQYLPQQSGCVFTATTMPPYRQAANVYYFSLQGENTLGKRKTDYKFQPYVHVLPDPPSALSIVEGGSRVLHVKWHPPKGMDLFPPSLYYQLEYSSEWNQTNTIMDLDLNVTTEILKGLTPNTVYEVRVRARSGAATSTLWSNPAFASKMTPPDVPDGFVNTTRSAFQQRKTINSRDIVLYWQALPAILSNGNRLTYLVDALEDGLQRNLSATPLGVTSVQLSSLELESSYVFRIRASNEVGVSRTLSYLPIGPVSTIPHTPDHVTVIAFFNGVYEVSWKWSGHDEITNFTVFFCHAHTNRPGVHCYNSSIRWVFMEPTKNRVNLTLFDYMNYEFGVSVNVNGSSSGIVWATCIVPYNGVVGKMKSVSVIRVTTREIFLTWRLECTERTGIMKGFSIYYCSYDNISHTCSENQTRLFIDDPNSSEFVLTKLKPYTMYEMMVTAVTRAGEGEQSNPLVNTTLEGAPEDSPRVSLTLLTNVSATILVQPPTVPNGVIRQVHFNPLKLSYSWPQENNEFVITSLTPYTNYTVQAVVCTTREFCSPPADVLFTTDIGIPGQPEITEVRPANSSYLMIEWEDPVDPNGPIAGWVIRVSWFDPVKKEDLSQERTYVEDNGNRMLFVPYPITCPEEKDSVGGMEFNVSVRMLTVMMDGLSSKSVLVTCPGGGIEENPIWMYVLISIGSVLVFGCIIYILIRVGHRLNRKVREMQNIKVQLPKGLDYSNITAPSYEAFKAQLNSMSPQTTHPLLTTTNCDHECEPRFSSSSIDELLTKMKSSEIHNSSCPPSNKSHRNLSGDSGHESVMSSATNRTHLSIDSGNEMDPFPNTLSPDCVFEEPWKIPTLSKVCEEKCIAYAQLASTKRVEPSADDQYSNIPMIDSGYSKIGTSSSSLDERHVQPHKDIVESATFPRFTSERRPKTIFSYDDNLKYNDKNDFVALGGSHVDFENYSCVGIGNVDCGYIPLDTMTVIGKSNEC